MYSIPNYIRIAALFCLVSIVLSCSVWETGQVDETADTRADRQAENNPFLAKEPERYQAKVVMTSFFDEEKESEMEFRIIRDGVKMALTIRPGSEEPVTFISEGGGTETLVDHSAGTFQTRKMTSTGSGLARDLVSGWLAREPGTKYSLVSESENKATYRVTSDSAKLTEIVVEVDKKNFLPVLTEFYSLANGSRKLLFTYEVTDFEDSPDPGAFRVPDGFRKVED